MNSLATAKGRGDLFRERLTALIDLLTGPGAPRGDRLTALIDLLTGPGAARGDRLRAGMALGGVSVGWMFFADHAPDRRELGAEVLKVACELADASPPGPPQ